MGEQEYSCFTRFDEPATALAFKIVSDSFAGSLAFIRVYSGIVKVGAQMLNPRQNKKERIQRLVKIHANAREEVKELRAGDIGAVVGLRFTGTGDTICEARRPVVLESIQFPDPVISVAIEAKSTAEQDKMHQALERLQKEDPSCSIRTDAETGQMLLSGMGELHLEILVDRMLREYKVAANVGSPQISYRETLVFPVSGSATFEREINGKLQYAFCRLEVNPQERGRGVSFSSGVPEGAIPKEFIEIIEVGVKEAAEVGPLVGASMIDIQIVLLEVGYREDESSEMSFKVASSMAFRNALLQSRSQVLEPIFKIEVVTPEDYMGNIIGNLNGRRGQVKNMFPRAQLRVVDGEVPLVNLFGYATDLRSISQGRATFSMEFLEYRPVPPKVEREILMKLGRQQKEDK